MSERIDQDYIRRGLKLISDHWILRIISHLGPESLRFVEIERSIADINAVTLTNRLKVLEENGMVTRAHAPGKKAVVYSLTPKGRDLLPIIQQLWKFGLKYHKS